MIFSAPSLLTITDFASTAATTNNNKTIHILVFVLLGCYAAFIGSYWPTFLDSLLVWSSRVNPECWQLTTNKRCVTFQKSEDLIYTTVEAWNHSTYSWTSAMEKEKCRQLNTKLPLTLPLLSKPNILMCSETSHCNVNYVWEFVKQTMAKYYV
jgi:hypothetical protein